MYVHVFSMLCMRFPSDFDDSFLSFRRFLYRNGSSSASQARFAMPAKDWISVSLYHPEKSGLGLVSHLEPLAPAV